MKKWLYANRLHGIDHPPSHQRLIGWFLKQHRFDGYLLWSMNHWPLDPWTTLPGEQDAYRRGTFLYPDPATGLPWPTLRLEAWRRGLEDFQYFTLLEEAHHQGRVEASSYQHLMARLEALTADVPTLKPRAAWAELEAVRLRMGQLLEAGSQPVGAPPAWERPQRGEPRVGKVFRPRRAQQFSQGAGLSTCAGTPAITAGRDRFQRPAVSTRPAYGHRGPNSPCGSTMTSWSSSLR
jgi:hypothetical protein